MKFASAIAITVATLIGDSAHAAQLNNQANVQSKCGALARRNYVASPEHTQDDLRNCVGELLDSIAELQAGMSRLTDDVDEMKIDVEVLIADA